MIRLSREKVLLLHQLIVAETGGENGIRDLGLLDSALGSAFATFDGQDLYPSKEEKAAHLGYALIGNHAFVDGNKRIGMYAMLTFLDLNGIHMDLTDQDIVCAGLGVASGEMNGEDLLQWVKDHMN